MRRAEGKKMGYVILPVGVPAGVPPEQALSDNEKYRVVWQILNALRAHDDRFDATINKAMEINDVPVVVDFRVERDAMVWPMVPAGTSNDDIQHARDVRPEYGED